MLLVCDPHLLQGNRRLCGWNRSDPEAGICFEILGQHSCSLLFPLFMLINPETKWLKKGRRSSFQDLCLCSHFQLPCCAEVFVTRNKVQSFSEIFQNPLIDISLLQHHGTATCVSHTSKIATKNKTHGTHCNCSKLYRKRWYVNQCGR